MTEIIKFPGKYNGPQDDNSPGDELSTSSKVDSKETKIDPKHYLDMLRVVGGFSSQLGRKLSLKGNLQKLVSEYTDEEVAGFINRSNLMDWQTKPTFYKLLIDETRKRELGKFGL